ncbi:MAG TPA: SWIM zinc finger family protein, partial [Pedococcus sp.]
MTGYAAASTLTDRADGAHLGLETATGLTPTGLVERPVFFRGLLARPDVTACGLLAVADVAASRYVDAGLAQRLASLDPVVTASGDRLRFESFSACNSVHARLDVLPDGLVGGEVGFGTTNVDINQPLRTALAAMGGTELLHLTVGPDELSAATPTEHHVERKVALPDRWVRGLAEVPSVTAGMREVVRLVGPQVDRLARELPRSAPPGPVLHLLPPPRGPRLLPRALPGTIAIPGAARLRGAERILRHTSVLTIHQDEHGATSWTFDLPGARFVLVLTADPWRGFSGEGTLLARLA